MKKLLTTLLVTTAGLLTSCSSEDVEKSTTAGCMADGTPVMLNHSLVNKAPQDFDPDNIYRDLLMKNYETQAAFRIYYTIPTANYQAAEVEYYEGATVFHSNDYHVDFEIKTSHRLKGTFSGIFMDNPDPSKTSVITRNITKGTFDIRY